MKKMLYMFLVLICIAFMAGCADDLIDDSSVNEVQLENDTEESNETNEDVTDPHKVTKSEWESALKFEIPATKVSQHVWYPKTETKEEKFIYYDVREYGENVIRIYDMDETLSHSFDERYYVKNGDAYTRYYKSGNPPQWVSESSNQSSYESNYDRINGMEIFSYDDFIYDETEQVYQCEQITVEDNGQSFTYYNVIMRFNNGKLDYWYAEAEVDGYNCFKTMYSYDPIEITPPTLP